MKQLFFIIAAIITTTTAAAQSKQHKKEKINGTYNTYTSIIIDGKEYKQPERIQAIRCMIQYLNNNWLETSNIYRSEHVHTSLNYSSNKKTFNNV